MKRVVAVHLKLRPFFPRISKEERRVRASAAGLQERSFFFLYHIKSRKRHQLDLIYTLDVLPRIAVSFLIVRSTLMITFNV
jgi:hypothetical protein